MERVIEAVMMRSSSVVEKRSYNGIVRSNRGTKKGTCESRRGRRVFGGHGRVK